MPPTATPVQRALSNHVNTFGQAMLRKYGQRVHKIAINAGFTCPNRDGTKGLGGCTFCNNSSFNPNNRRTPSVTEQVAAGQAVIRKRTRALRYLAYFQAYTNTYGDPDMLRRRYDEALADPNVIGFSVGTRPDCVPEPVLDLLAEYRDRGLEIWVELGLQTAFDDTLRRVNRGHTFSEYQTAIRAAHHRGLSVCTHLIAGLPGETAENVLITLDRVLAEGVEGLKLHPLHVVKGTRLANQWRQGEYQPLTLDAYITVAADLVERTPAEVIFHRLTGTAAPDLLLAPHWCIHKWRVLNGIEQTLNARGARQGDRAAASGILGCLNLAQTPPWSIPWQNAAP